VEGHNLADRVIEQVLGDQMNRDDREDLIQDGFIRLLEHPDKLTDCTRGQLISYMCKTMQNCALDEGRRMSRERALFCDEDIQSIEQEAGELTPEERYLEYEYGRERLRILERVKAQLNERERRLLIEKYENGLSDERIGALLDIPAAHVRVYVGRARKKAAACWEKLRKEG